MSYGWQSRPGLELRTRLLQLGGFTRLWLTPGERVLGGAAQGTPVLLRPGHDGGRPRAQDQPGHARHASGAWQLVRDDVSVAGAGLPGDRRAPVGAGGQVQAAAG